MFSGISNLIFGSTSSTEPEVEKSESPCASNPPTDDEWEFVDQSSNKPNTPKCRRRALVKSCSAESDCQSAGSDVANAKSNLSMPSTMSSSQHSSGSGCSDRSDSDPRVLCTYHEHGSDSDAVLSDVSSVPEIVNSPSMSESWLMTPPPCFTAGSNSPAAREVKSNSMENLLIEHPSMSVYHSRGRPSSTGLESEDGHESSSDTEMAEVNSPEPVSRSRAISSPHTSGRSRAITAKQQLLAQQRVRRSMQSQQRKKDGKKLTKSQLQRSNNVAHANHGRPKRRQHFMQLRNSGACIDRKSQ